MARSKGLGLGLLEVDLELEEEGLELELKREARSNGLAEKAEEEGGGEVEKVLLWEGDSGSERVVWVVGGESVAAPDEEPRCWNFGREEASKSPLT